MISQSVEHLAGLCPQPRSNPRSGTIHRRHEGRPMIFAVEGGLWKLSRRLVNDTGVLG